MSTATPENQISTVTTGKQDVIDFGVADEVIQNMRQRYIGLEAGTHDGYQQVREAIADVRSVRVGVEKSRKELKASALEWGRKVDAEAKRVTALLLEVEEPLKAEKQRIDDEKLRVAREKKEAAERERLAKEQAERERIEAEQKAERERIEKEQQAERLRLDAERKKLEAEQAEQRRQQAEREAELKAEREAIQAERQQIEAEKRRQREEADRVERERRAEVQKKEAARLAAERAPDVTKLRLYAKAIEEVELPSVTTEWGKGVLENIKLDISCAVDAIRDAAQSQESPGG